MKTYFGSFMIILTVVSLYAYSIAPPTGKFFVSKHQPEYLSLNFVETLTILSVFFVSSSKTALQRNQTAGSISATSEA
jgi:hypothetical protein